MFKVVSHGMLMNCGWNSIMCWWFSSLCYIYYTSQSYIVRDLVFVLALWVFTLLFTNCTTKTLKNMFYLFLSIEIVLACSLVVWEQFPALKYLAALSGTKLKHTFLGLFSIQLVLRGGQNQQIIKTTLHQTIHSGY